MSKLRISIVEFLNTAPLVWGFTDGPLRGRYDLSFTMPSLCAEALRSGQADVAIILGANDVVNPAALQKGTPIYGMPILEAYKAKTVIVNKRSMAAGYAGLDNELFYMDKTMMVFGDAKKVVEDMVKAVD